MLAVASAGVPADAPLLSIAIGELTFAPALRLRDITFNCARLAVDDRGLACLEGSLAVGESPLGALRVPFSGRLDATTSSLKTADFALASGRAQLTFDLAPRQQRLRARLRGIALPALQALARQATPTLPLLATHEITAGTIDLDLDCRLRGDDGARRVGNCTARGVVQALDVAGTNSAEGAHLRFDLVQRDVAQRQAWQGEFALESGALYLEPGFTLGTLTPGLLLKVGDGPIVATLVAARAADGRITLDHCQLQHPGVAAVAFDGDATLWPAPAWRDASLSFSTTALDRFYGVYLQPLLLGTSLGGLATRGNLDVRLQVRGGALAALDVDCRDCALEDEGHRFAIAGLQGGLRLHDGTAPRTSSLSWDSASLYRIALGAGHIGWSSTRGDLQAVDWQDVAIFDGALHLDDMRLVDFGTSRAKLVLAGRIDPITLSSLTTSFGWPPLAGRVAGTIPRITISRRRIAVDGDVEIAVFGGHVLLSKLLMTDVFGAVPSLRTDVHVRGLDLAQLTSTFSFGNIEGHLGGDIRDLRLEAWQPVSFDAYLATPADDDLPHRISRQAVSNLSKIGAGTGGPLASGWLSLIPSYSFGQLGLGCRLANGVCQMRGVESLPDGGFKLLTRGGLLPPWIEIRGAGNQVAWQTLLDGVAQIAQGGVEVEVNVGRAEARPPEQQP